jgi:hypothetical protein
MISDAFSSLFEKYFARPLDDADKMKVKSALVFDFKVSAVLVLPCAILDSNSLAGVFPFYLVKEAITWQLVQLSGSTMQRVSVSLRPMTVAKICSRIFPQST